jgi:hypothetical protein
MCLDMGLPLRREEWPVVAGHLPSTGGDLKGHSLPNWPSPPHTLSLS